MQMINKLTGIWLTIMLVASTLGTQSCTPVIIAGTLAGTGTSIAMDRRKMAKMIEDQAIEMQATDAIYSDQGLTKYVRVAVTSYNGIVLLTGETPTEAMKNAVQSIIEPLRNVRKIFNEIKIASPISLANRSNDTWITTKIKARLASNDAFNSHAKVVTSNGIVYLMGLVSPEESVKIIDISASTKGIDRIITLFEPIDPSVPLNNTTLVTNENAPTTPLSPPAQGNRLDASPQLANTKSAEPNTAESAVSTLSATQQPAQAVSPTEASDEDDITILPQQNILQMSSE